MEEDKNLIQKLSPAQKRVLFWVAQGLSNKEICEKLCIENCTVVTHLAGIYKKLGLRGETPQTSVTRLRAALMYIENQ